MPIKPENRGLYAPNWKDISKAVREAAGNKCEGCGVRNHAMICRHPTLDTFIYVIGFSLELGTFDHLEYPDGTVVTDRLDVQAYKRGKVVKVVLTVAHLDHDPRNNDRSNLRAYCQQCHNRYDRAHRNETAAATRRAKSTAGQLPLFGDD